MKTRRKLIVLSIFSFFISINGFSQRMYFNAGLGYNFPAGSGIIAVHQNTGNMENRYGSYGEGLIGAIGIGYMFSKNIGGELGFSILPGKTFDYSYTSSGFYSEYTNIGKMKRLVPALKITVGSKLMPYAKIGLVLGINHEINMTNTQVLSHQTDIFTNRLSGGISIGFMNTIGVDISANEKVSLYVEVMMIDQSWAPEKNEYTKSIVNNVLGSQYHSGTINYVDNVTSYQSEKLKEFFPFGSFGINAGVKLTFWKK